MKRARNEGRVAAPPADTPTPSLSGATGADVAGVGRPDGKPWSCYQGEQGAQNHLSVEEIKRALASGSGTLWLDIDNRKPEEVALLTDVFGFHPLAVEDSLNPDSRVKIEEYDGYLILIVRTVDFIHETEDPYDIKTVNLTCFLGANYLVTVHGEQSDSVRATAELLGRKPELAAAGAARLMHAVVDEAVNAYFPILDQLDLFMDSLEERVFATFDQGALREIFSVKRLVLSLRRHLAPQRNVFAVMTNRPSTLLSLDTQIYYRDIHDHVLRINDALETYRELLSSTLDSYLTQVSNRLGTVTKALSAVATVSIPFVIVSGMWGMNFDVIPLAHWRYGFWTMVAVQLGLGIFLLAVLRWRKLL